MAPALITYGTTEHALWNRWNLGRNKWNTQAKQLNNEQPISCRSGLWLASRVLATVCLVGQDSNHLFEQLTAALQEKEDARQRLRAAERRELAILTGLHESGMPWSQVAARWAKARGQVLTLRERQRLAARFRQWASRVTRGHGFQPSTDGDEASRLVASGQTEIAPMPATLIRRTTTVEEFSNEEPEEIPLGDLEEEPEAEVDDGKAKCEVPEERGNGKAGALKR